MSGLDTPTEILLGTLLLAGILISIVYQRLRVSKQIAALQLTGSLLTQYLGKPQLDVRNSWATSLTTLGALLGSVLSAGGLSGNKTNIGLNLFFGVLVLLAPIVYTATATYIETDTEDGKGPSEPQGYLWIFLLTSLLTLWAVCGELVTMMILLFNLTATTIFTSPIKSLFLLFLLAALVCMGVYAIRTIPWTVQEQLQTAQQARLRLMKGVPGQETPTGKQPRPSMKPWSLL